MEPSFTSSKLIASQSPDLIISGDLSSGPDSLLEEGSKADSGMSHRTQP